MITALSLIPKGGFELLREDRKEEGGAIVGRVFPQLWSNDFDVKLAQVVLEDKAIANVVVWK